MFDKKVLMALMVLLGYGLALWAGPAYSASPAAARPTTQAFPKISVPEQQYDFGSVEPDDMVTHDFYVTNNGLGDLTIEKVVPG